MTNIIELKMNVDLLISDKKIGNIDITISNCKLFVVQVKKLDEVLYINTFIDTLLEELSQLKQKFKCKQIKFSLLQTCSNVTKNDILDYITNRYY